MNWYTSCRYSWGPNHSLLSKSTLAHDVITDSREHSGPSNWVVIPFYTTVEKKTCVAQPGAMHIQGPAINPAWVETPKSQHIWTSYPGALTGNFPGHPSSLQSFTGLFDLRTLLWGLISAHRHVVKHCIWHAVVKAKALWLGFIVHGFPSRLCIQSADKRMNESFR